MLVVTIWWKRTQSSRINNMGETKGNEHRNILFTAEEYKKAAGIELVEQLKNIGPRAHRCLHVCFTENPIPKVWRQSKIIAILKPGRLSDTEELQTLLCHMYKLYERLILNRIAPSVDRHLIKEQAGFRPGKSCCSQLFNLTQHIDDGYQRGMITGRPICIIRHSEP